MCYNVWHMKQEISKAIKNGTYIIHGDWLDSAYISYEEAYESRQNPILIEKYSPSDLGISRRVLSHWRGSGLVESKWKLSLRDVFWLRLCNKLRDFGLSIDKILKVKEGLFDIYWSVPLLDLYLTLKLANRKRDIYILVFSNGDANIATPDELSLSEACGLVKDGYIKISMQSILNETLKNESNPIVNETRVSLKSDEVDVIQAIRERKYKEITIKLKDGKLTHLKKQKTKDNPDVFNEIREAIKEKQFGEIAVKLENGKVVHLTNNVMQKTLDSTE